MKKTALLLMIITILSKLFGFGREMVLAYYYGTSNISDAYIVAMTIPTVIFAFIGNGISTAYIPLYLRLDNKEGISRANQYTNNLINILLLVCTVLIGIALIFTEPIVQVFASGFEGNTLELAVQFTRISIFGIYFTALISILSAYLQIKGNYIIPAFAGFPLNLIVIFSIIISSRGNILVLAYGILLSTVIQLLFILPAVLKKNLKYRRIINFKDAEVKNMLFLALPVILGVAVNEVNTIVDKTLASQISIGGISALNYAQKLNGFVQGIIVASIGTAMYPMISKYAVEGNLTKLKKVLSESIVGTSVLVTPCMIGAMLLSKSIIEILFGRGAFDEQAIIMTSNALFFYSIGMIGMGLRNIISRPFYALQDTKTPMKNASIGVLMNIVLNIILSRYLGIGGLALATSISSIFIVGLLFISLRKKIGPFGMKQISISFLKILFASLIMGGLAKLSFNYLTATLSQSISLLIAIGVGAISYFIIIYFMKIEDVDVIVGAIKKKLGKGAA
jgi:putative peptidoglycan lipid II flippase